MTFRGEFFLGSNSESDDDEEDSEVTVGTGSLKQDS